MAEPSFNIQGPGGDVIGAGVAGSGHIIGKQVTVEGNIIQLVNPSPEAIAALARINAMATAVPPGSPGGLKGSATVDDSAGLQARIDELLGLLKQTGATGQTVRTINAGGVNLSRVDLLLKKAILLKSEADQMYFTQGAKMSPAGPAGKRPADREAGFKEVDAGRHMSRLRESYGHLQEANELDPTNTEVLLAMAQLLIELTPDDSSDERRLLYRIQKLLGSPRDDDERFRLAQATFLMATTSEPLERDSLQDARGMFEKLGRGEWVRQCDARLGADPVKSPPPSPAASGDEPPPLPRTAARPPPVYTPPPPPPAFQPVGRWQFQITDAVGSVMVVDLFPNGLFNATQNAGPFAPSVQAQGQWLFNPYNQMLQLQGLIAGYMPFMLGVVIQRPHLNGFHGVGTDNCAYFITRVG